MSRFESKTVIVTGAASGIGLATATRFGREGARVVVADLNAEHATKAAESIEAAGAPDTWGCMCDVSDEQQVAACVAGTIERFGTLDVVVNNAGLMRFKSIVDLTADDWRRVLGVDLLGAFFFVLPRATAYVFGALCAWLALSAWREAFRRRADR